MPKVERQALVACLQVALTTIPDVDAAWEGGSAGFGTADALSDLDLVLVVADHAIPETFAAVERALEALSPIALRYDVPGTVGYTQRFYSLRDASEFLVLDLVCIRRSDPLMFREMELHGNGTVWLDRTGVLQETHVDASADQTASLARLPQLRAAFAMFQHIPTKERLRGRAVEALHFYQAMTVRPLVEALRLWHCPQRRMFSVRYLARDLPAPVAERITDLSFVKDLSDLEYKHAQAQAWFWETMAHLERNGPGGAATATVSR